MNNVLYLLFSTTFLHACVNGGALRSQEGIGYPSSTLGVWPGTPGLAGAPAVQGSPGSWSGPAVGHAPAGYVGSRGSWTGPVAHTGAPGGWTGSSGYTGAQNSWSEISGYSGGPRVGAWPSPSGYTETPGVTGSWSGLAGYPGAPGSSGSLSGPNGSLGAPVGYSGPTAVPEVLPDGSIADVPEVATARAAHLSAVQVASSDPRLADSDDGEYNPYKYGDHLHFHHDLLSSGPVGYNVNGLRVNGKPAIHSNVLVEEAAWKAEQSAEEQRALSVPRGNSYGNAETAISQLIAKNAAASATPSHTSGVLVQPYAGPLAIPQVLPSGYIADTVEVNEARQNHLRTLAAAEASAAKWEDNRAGWN